MLLMFFVICFPFCIRVVDEAKVRKAYFRMAQKYHPDKNPEGRVRPKYYSWRNNVMLLSNFGDENRWLSQLILRVHCIGASLRVFSLKLLSNMTYAGVIAFGVFGSARASF